MIFNKRFDNLLHKTVWLIILFQLLLFNSVYAVDRINESELKAAFSIRLLSYVNIPLTDTITQSDSNELLNQETFQPKVKDVCLYPKNPFNDYIKDYVKNFSRLKQIPLELHYPKKISELSKCDLVYLSDVKKNELDEINALAKSYAFLTISDSEEFIHKGGMIELFLKKNRLKFKVNQQATVDAGLKLNTLLLGLAEEIIKAKKKG